MAADARRWAEHSSLALSLESIQAGAIDQPVSQVVNDLVARISVDLDRVPRSEQDEFLTSLERAFPVTESQGLEASSIEQPQTLDWRKVVALVAQAREELGEVERKELDLSIAKLLPPPPPLPPGPMESIAQKFDIRGTPALDNEALAALVYALADALSDSMSHVETIKYYVERDVEIPEEQRLGYKKAYMIAIASALKDLKSPAALARVHELHAKIEAHSRAHEGTLLRLINIQDVSDIDQRIRPIDPKVIRGKISEKSKAWDALEAVLKDGLAPWLKMRLLEAAKSSYFELAPQVRTKSPEPPTVS